MDRFLEKNSKQTSSLIAKVCQPKIKTMKDSYVEEYLPFKTDKEFREEYVNVYGRIRLGKILEDLDALAGSIAYKHCDDGREDTLPLTIVTGIYNLSFNYQLVSIESIC
jgi:acyl-coenzyme A thioesterase 9